MMLSATTDKFQTVTSSAATIDVSITYFDASSSTGAFSGGGKQNTAIASAAATTDVLAAPAASTLRRMKFGSWRNKDASLSCDVTVVFDQNGTDFEIHKVSLAPGDCLQYIEGIGFFTLTVAAAAKEFWKALSADATGADSATQQPWFPSGGALAVEAGGVYEFYGRIHISRAAGATSHTTGFGMAGTATITDYGATYECGEGEVVTFADSDVIVAEAVADLQVKAASTTTTEQIKGQVTGVVIINAAGTIIPSFKYSAAPGGAPTIRAGTFFHVQKLAPNPQGAWT